MKHQLKWPGILLVGILVLSSAFIGYAQDDTEPDTEYTEEEITAGYQLFLNNGCIACHGMSAEGTGIAPALAGHSANEVRNQVRIPMGIMPVFPPDRISGEELELLVAYVTTLGGGHLHAKVEIAERAMLLYHWLAYDALQGGDVEESIHYVEHLTNLAVGEHSTRMQQVLAQLRIGQIELASITLENMLTNVETISPELAEIDPASLHLQMASAAASSGFVDETIHHIGHYIGLTPDEDHTELEEVLAGLDDALQNAEHTLGEMVDGMAMEGDHDDDDDHADDAEGDHDDDHADDDGD